jgi:hypothetical protein
LQKKSQAPHGISSFTFQKAISTCFQLPICEK